MIRLGIINSNCVAINQNTKKGTEIFDYILIKNLTKKAYQHRLKVTAFASGNSHLPVPIESVNYLPSFIDPDIGTEHLTTFEMALVSKAFSQQENFDMYHVNIGNGDVVLPFAPFVKKPIIVTMHGSFLEEKYNQKYLSLFKNLKNIYFVSISDAQRLPLPGLNYVKTIYHGVDLKHVWTFNPRGGDRIIWAGRAIREKGLDDVLRCIKKTGKKAHLFPLIKDVSPQWLKKMKAEKVNVKDGISFTFDTNRHKLAEQYQQSKLFLSPIKWEEPFGMVMIEALSCGTPVVSYARGSAPEVIEDGVTGFLINPSPNEIRGEFVIKKTGVEGLCEAIEKIYSLSDEKYHQMRLACRKNAEERFAVSKMISEYISLYKEIAKKKKM